jgi:hypothetical protein
MFPGLASGLKGATPKTLVPTTSSWFYAYKAELPINFIWQVPGRSKSVLGGYTA